MDSHYRNAGYGSKENVITGSAEVVQEWSSARDKQIAILQFKRRLLGVESWSPAARADGAEGGNEQLTRCQSVILFYINMVVMVLLTRHDQLKAECNVRELFYTNLICDNKGN